MEKPSNIQVINKVKEKKWEERIFIATFILLLLVGTGLRFHGLTIQSHWTDELHSASFAAPSRSLAEVIKQTTHDAHPPLYHIFLWSTYRIFGYSELTGRTLSAVFGLLGLLAIFLLGKTLWNRKAGLFALAVLSPMFFHVFYSQDVRSYSLLFLLAVLSWWTMVVLIQKPGLFRTVIYAVFSSALIYTHYFGFFVLISQAVFMMILLVRYKKTIMKPFIYCVVAGGIVIISFLPWMPFFLGNNMLKETWIQPVSIGFVWTFISRYFLTGGKVLWISVPLITVLAWLWPDPEKENSKKEPEFSPNLMLLVWIVITYGLPFVLSSEKVPMLIPRVTMITVPAIILLISGPAARLKMKYLIPISILTCVFMATILISKNHYYTFQWRENWRGIIQHVMGNDPAARYPVVSNRWSAYYGAYFRMVGDFRPVVRGKYFERKIPLIPSTEGFWFLDAHDMKGMSSRLKRIVFRFFKPVDVARFKRANATFFRFKSLSAKAKMVGGIAIPKHDDLSLVQFNGNFQKLPNGGIRLCSNGTVESVPFIFPEGDYQIQVLMRGNRVQNKTARFKVSVGNQVVITGFTKEKSSWYEGELHVRHPDVFPICVSFLNDYFEEIKSDTPLYPGSVIKLREGDWDGTLTRTTEARTYNAHWENRTTGKTVSDTITVKKFTPASIILCRKSLDGCYRGELSPDGTFATGTADWYKGNGKWTARFPEMKFTGKLDRNLDILKIKIVSITFRSEH